MLTMTRDSRRLFEALARDACNWNGMPLLGGNVPTDQHTNGNVTHLKKLGLITTENDPEHAGDVWVSFTPAGVEKAHALCISINGEPTGGETHPADCAHTNPVPYKSDGVLGHGWECGDCRWRWRGWPPGAEEARPTKLDRG